MIINGCLVDITWTILFENYCTSLFTSSIPNYPSELTDFIVPSISDDENVSETCIKDCVFSMNAGKAPVFMAQT